MACHGKAVKAGIGTVRRGEAVRVRNGAAWRGPVLQMRPNRSRKEAGGGADNTICRPVDAIAVRHGFYRQASAF